MNKIILKGRICLDQNTLEPAVELVRMYENKEARILISQQDIDEWKILTGKNLIDVKKEELKKKLMK
jgi:hypothetical protein